MVQVVSLTIAVLAALLAGLALLRIARGYVMLRSRRRPRARSRHRSAWVEAGRRAELAKPEDTGDTVDLDPGEIGPEDIEPGGPRGGS